jgi:hypothetical protein
MQLLRNTVDVNLVSTDLLHWKVGNPDEVRIALRIFLKEKQTKITIPLAMQLGF